MKKTFVNYYYVCLNYHNRLYFRTEVSHDEFKALDGPKVLVHYDDGSTELLEEQEYLERTISMTQEQIDELHKVDESTDKYQQSGKDPTKYRTYSEDIQQEPPKRKEKALV